jgi:hypothetical protein
MIKKPRYLSQLAVRTNASFALARLNRCLVSAIPSPDVAWWPRNNALTGDGSWLTYIPPTTSGSIMSSAIMNRSVSLPASGAIIIEIFSSYPELIEKRG